MTPQLSLLSDTMAVQKPSIAGLLYLPNYIDASQAESLTSSIDNESWLTGLKRRVQHYGYRYDYKARNITPDAKLGALPSWLSGICGALCSDNLFSRNPDQVIVNEYQAGQGIAPHIDCIPCFKGIIASLSLGSACVVNFTHKTTRETVSLLLEPQSLLVLSGEARYDWQHGIAHRKTDKYNGVLLKRGRRLSLTFRNVILSK